jgi:hypothetical protein
MLIMEKNFVYIIPAKHTYFIFLLNIMRMFSLNRNGVTHVIFVCAQRPPLDWENHWYEVSTFHMSAIKDVVQAGNPCCNAVHVRVFTQQTGSMHKMKNLSILSLVMNFTSLVILWQADTSILEMTVGWI